MRFAFFAKLAAAVCVLACAAAARAGTPNSAYVWNQTGSTIYVKWATNEGNFGPEAVTSGSTWEKTTSGSYPDSTFAHLKLYTYESGDPDGYFYSTGDHISPWLLTDVDTTGGLIVHTTSDVEIQRPWVGVPPPTEVEAVFIVAAKVMALGVICGGLVFCTRFLWRFFAEVVGGATWSD